MPVSKRQQNGISIEERINGIGDGIMAAAIASGGKTADLGIGVMANENGGEKAAWRHQAASAASQRRKQWQ
jgi:hypothetical protein